MKFFQKITKVFTRFRILLIFGIGILLTVAMFPREGKFRYEFQKGKPWMHQVLVAPFDFPIYKTESALQTEKDSLLKDFQPFYKLDSTVYLRLKERLDQEMNAQWETYTSLPANENMVRNWKVLEGESVRAMYLASLNEILSNLYEYGIVHDPYQLENFRRDDTLLNIISGQLVQKVSVNQVFTQKTAYQEFSAELEEYGKQIQPRLTASSRFSNFFNPIELVESNLFYDEAITLKMKEALLGQISLSQGMVQAGEKIIGLGEPVTEEKIEVLQSLKYEYEKSPDVLRNYNMILLGQFLLVTCVLGVLYLFLLHFRPEVLVSGNRTFFIVFLFLIMASLAILTIRAQSLNLYVVPFVILPIIIKTFYDARIALFVHMITILLIGFWAPNGFEFVFLNFIAGVVAIFTLRNLYRRGVLFITSVVTLLSYSIVYTAIGLIQEGRIENLEWTSYAWFLGNSLLILTSYPLIYLFERGFGFVSDATLVELSDTNQPLLRKLAELAPGTFQHSLQVANLAEEAALSIGANSLLVRTGALYHDIGKMNEPMYFIENLTSGFNPHDKLEFEVSAGKIIAHVTDGVEIAKKHRLPEVIIDFIRTHHGTTTVQYFYRSFLKEHPESETDSSRFSYPGPRPFSKETAILMMADSTEAASRSLKKYDTKIINNLVDNIIDYQMRENQFVDVDLTLKDIQQIRSIFKNKLRNIYHARIEYPV
jgi:putative nucleotidyltransferase with HDIG domain